MATTRRHHHHHYPNDHHQYAQFQQQQQQQQQNNNYSPSLSAAQRNTNTWFVGAPLTKILTIVMIFSYIALEFSFSSSSSSMTSKYNNNKASNKYKKLTNIYQMDVNKLFFNNFGDQHNNEFFVTTTFYKNLYRLITGHMTFHNINGGPGTLLMGIGVFVFLSRKFEREMNTKKFANYLFFTFLISLLCLYIISYVLKTIITTTALVVSNNNNNDNSNNNNNNIQYFGPYPIIGSLFILYHIYTPSIYPKFVSLLGFQFSEKFISYLFILQVVCFSGGGGGGYGFYYNNTIIPTTCGYIAGYVHTQILSKNSTCNKYLQLPSFLMNICTKISSMTLFMFYDEPTPLWGPIYPLSSSSSSSNSINRRNGLGGDGVGYVPLFGPAASAAAATGAGGGGIRSRNNNNNNGNDSNSNNNNRPIRGVHQQQNPLPPPSVMPPPTAIVGPPPEHAIEQLTSMGFSRDDVIRVLRETENNIELAADRLLTQ